MSRPSNEAVKVVPAQLSYLAIFNRSFGPNEESAYDQIIFYHSKRKRGRGNVKQRPISKPQPQDDRQFEEDEKSERLRQIGLAQGMVDFAKNFSNGEPVDSIETEKSRIVLQELEPDWWILASIDLTRLPTTKKTVDSSTQTTVEYSSREVSSSPLLRKQLQRAHSIFLLHHAASLWDLYNRIDREHFCNILEKYWKKFAINWDVLLHGNPVIDIYNGIKLAGAGELGIGVGEEEWGSGEREVLEGFVTRTEGLIDLVVGRYGDEPKQVTVDQGNSSGEASVPKPWLGNDIDTGLSDGIIFSGVGTLTKQSLATVSQWMETIFRQGEIAYGVGENPSSRPRQRRKTRKANPAITDDDSSSIDLAEETPPKIRENRDRTDELRRKAFENNASAPKIPAPLVGAVERSLNKATANVQEKPSADRDSIETQESGSSQDSSAFSNTTKMIEYLKLGYGSSWTLDPKGLKSTTEANAEEQAPEVDSQTQASETPIQELDPTPDVSDAEKESFVQKLEQSIGRFLIGLSGDLENTDFDSDPSDEPDASSQTSQRIFLRTLIIQLAKARPTSINSGDEQAKFDNPDLQPVSNSVHGSEEENTPEKFQVAIYVHQPFIFCFLFELHTPNLTIPSFYRGIHHQLGPLQKPLLRSTDPANIPKRIAELLGENESMSNSNKEATIYDVVYDPVKMTIRTSLPNIPIPGSLAAEGLTSRSSSITVSGSWYTLGIPIGSNTGQTPSSDQLVKSEWTRIEALSIHTQILNIWADTRSGSEFERTIKTNRAWWILWMKVSGRQVDESFKEAILVRKAPTDPILRSKEKTSTSGRWLLRDQSKERIGGNNNNSNTGSGTTSTKGVAEGLGLDARKWVDCLLHLN